MNQVRFLKKTKSGCATCLTQRELCISLSLEQLDTLGMVKCLENIGEAANRLTMPTRTLMAEIPWPRVIAMRHRLVHEYFEVDLDLVWVTATVHLPPLIHAIERTLGKS